MANFETAQNVSRPTPWLRSLRWLARAAWRVVWFLLRMLLVSWGTLALYYSNLPWHWGRVALAVVFLGLAVWALWIDRRRPAYLAFAAVYLAVIVWFALIPPSHDRPWATPDAVLPKAVIDGDRVRLINVRHFDYRSRDDFTVHYEEREVDISHLTSLDLFVSYWKIGPVGHTFVSFNFDNAPPVCISIETRPEIGETFQPIASMFKQFELIYIVGDERDLVRLRTNFRGEETFMYPIRTSPENAQALFRLYLERINEIADRPEWYHLLKNSCTINIVRYANRVGRTGGFDIRLLLNGWVDRYLYRAGLVNTSLPFGELRRRSRITEVSQQAGNGEDYSQRIRAGLPVGDVAAEAVNARSRLSDRNCNTLELTPMLQTFQEQNRNLIVNINGRLVHRDEAGISPFDSAVQGGDAVWEGLRLYDGRIFRLREHLDRLRRSALALAFAEIPPHEKIVEEIRRTLEANRMRDGVHIRLTLTRGVKITSGMDPRLNQAGPTLIVLAEHKPPVYDQGGVKLITSSVRRFSPDCLDPKIHHNNLLQSILAKIEANAAGADDAVMLDTRGFVAETNATHLFAILGGIVTTSRTVACPEGVTRAVVLEICRANGIPHCERDVSLAEFYAADAVFCTGTMGEIVPVVEIDGRAIRDSSGTAGDALKRICDSFRQMTNEEGERLVS